MKRILITLWLALAGTGLFPAAAMTDNNPHVLTQLWAQYESARKADRPQKQLEILAQIKEEAQRQHLPVDFYDAASQYVQVTGQRNWKQREEATQNLAKEVAAFDEPIVTFRWMTSWDNASTDALWQYVQAHPDGFQGRTPAFYTNLPGYLGGCMPAFIQNDREYTLWYILERYNQPDAENNPVCQALAQEIGNRYPARAALDYFLVVRKVYGDREREQYKQALQAVADRYAGKAAALFPLGNLLLERMNELNKAKAGGEAFRAVYEEAKQLEARRKAYKGDEATVAKGCDTFKDLMETLTQKSLSVQFETSQARVLLQNLDAATLTLYQQSDSDRSKKTLKTWKLTNPKGSFYVQDTVVQALPALPDGTYYIEAVNGKIQDAANYRQFTLSLAARKDARGWSAYATDYQTGKPLTSVKLVLCKNGKDVSSVTVKQDGFTLLPKNFQKLLDGKTYYTLRAESGDRRSQPVSLYAYSYSENGDELRCNIYKDRGAYNPGDTLRFKAILYSGDPMRRMEVLKGKRIKVELTDAEENVIGTQELTTNPFGSVAGEFTLPKGLRNGYFALEIYKGEDLLASDDFRVDEFVLPNFTMAFDPYEKLYLAGDEVPVSGRLVSYSGHPLAGARITVKVGRYGNVFQEQTLDVEADNTFHTAFTAQEGRYEIEAIVTDGTGETQSFETSVYVGSEIEVGIDLQNAADASFTPKEEPDRTLYWYERPVNYVVDQDKLVLKLTARDAVGRSVPLPLTYSLLSPTDPEPVHNGSVLSGDVLELSLEGLPSGLYTLESTTSVKRGDKVLSAKKKACILLQRPQDQALTESVRRVFLSGPETLAAGEDITARLGTAEGDAYAVLSLYGNGKELLENRLVTVKNGTVADLSFHYKESYPDAVRLQIFYFLNGESVSYNRQYRRAVSKVTLPLECTRFQDKAYPGTQYSFRFQTSPDAELLVAAWDKSLDAIARNHWPVVSLRDYSVPSVSVEAVCGQVGGYGLFGRVRGMMLSKSSARAEGMVLMEAAAPMAANNAVDIVDDSIQLNDDEFVNLEETYGPVVDLSDVNIRSVFASALTFQPQLQPAADGSLEVSFRTSDKLSTYYVSVYAHDTAMRNALLQQEMVVSLPVKVAIQEPRFLYMGDVYEAALSVSSIAEAPVSGLLILRTPAGEQQLPVTVEPGATLTRSFQVPVTAEGTLPLTAVFKADDFSDAVQVDIPVYPAVQTLTEAHSAVLHAGQDRNALLAELRARFVNIPGSQASLKEISVLDMVRDAIPSHVDPAANDVLSLSEAWYVRLMASRLNGSATADGEGISSASLRDPVRANAPETPSPSANNEIGTGSPSLSTDELIEKIMACRNADGGFGWFEGMSSSPVITAVVLERLAKLRDRGFAVPEVESSVKYLDKNQFDASLPTWRGGLSDAQYMHVRALYSEVPFSWKAVSKTDKKRLSTFTKDAQAYLIPTKKAGRGLEGQILSKARRLLTLRNLQQRSGGLELAKAWGISFGVKSKLEKSIQADLASLLEYAVEHRDGGWYYPNAVMPWRGLLESEAYAHALLCDLLWAEAGMAAAEVGSAGAFARTGSRSDAEVEPTSSAATIADGIRLWLMLQKETQQWEAEPAFIDAITCILDGSEAVLQT
ncbi:MAG: hypothetical protein II171_06060, partial [Bacteroidales bacterium]|nr:hypothetical protein [Bacteroidales bacterium]